jgi:UDP-N-acetyl-L-fucosamine synthase
MALKLMTIVGTRPEIIRLSAVIKKSDEFFNQVLVHTGQNYDYCLNQIFFEDLGLRNPDHFLEIASGENLGDCMGNIIARSYKLMQQEKPDALLVLGDTNSALSAIAAKRLKIPVFHMEAGNRCFDMNVPEEINRRLVDHVSDINLPYTETSRLYLLNEGLPQDKIFVTGSPMLEVLHEHKEKITHSDALTKAGVDANKYFLLSAHREENLDIDYKLDELISAVNGLAEEFEYPIIYSMHPRSKKKIAKRNIKLHSLVKPMLPFSFSEYNKLQQNAFCVLSDSGTLTEESAMLGFPAVLMRTSTERPRGMESGSVVMSGIKSERVLDAVRLAVSKCYNAPQTTLPLEYEVKDVSNRVVNIILSYTDYVKLTVWAK